MEDAYNEESKKEAGAVCDHAVSADSEHAVGDEAGRDGGEGSEHLVPAVTARVRGYGH